MSDIHLHIVSFDVPYPANYGGVIDVFYKAKALTEHGVKVHLHCFEYGRKKSPELENLFYEVHYYKRDISKKHLFKSNPYIIETRISEKLVRNLLKDNYPILLEGLHTTGLLFDKRLKFRKRIVRTHNIEHEYYTLISLPFHSDYRCTDGEKGVFDSLNGHLVNIVTISVPLYSNIYKLT